jgi:hypothetical protein
MYKIQLLIVKAAGIYIVTVRFKVLIEIPEHVLCALDFSVHAERNSVYERKWTMLLTSLCLY